jgi:hypothetical protein
MRDGQRAKSAYSGPLRVSMRGFQRNMVAGLPKARESHPAKRPAGPFESKPLGSPGSSNISPQATGAGVSP